MALDNKEILEELLAEKRELDYAIAYFQRRIARTVTPARLSTSAPDTKTEEVAKTLGAKPYANMSMPDAAHDLLLRTGHALTIAEIKHGLLTGGLVSQAKNLNASIGTTLRRLREKSLVRKGPDKTWVAASVPEDPGLGLGA